MADLRSELKRLKDQLGKSTEMQISVAAKANSESEPVFRTTPSVQSFRNSGWRNSPASSLKIVPLDSLARLHVAVTRQAPPERINQVHHAATQNTKPVVSSIKQAPIAKMPATITPKVTAPQFRGVEKTFRPLPKGQPTRQHWFKNPDCWVFQGSETQSVSSSTGRGIDVVIGLDFGTSYTKAAVGFMDKIFPVTWEGVSKCEPAYLLPSEYTVMEDGHLYIGQYVSATSKELRSDLKLPFINPAVSSASIATASLFLALVLRYIRAWVYQHHGTKLASAKIRWQLNIGSPSNGLEKKSLETAYRKLAATAWVQSQSENLNRAASCLTGDWQEGQILKDLTDLQIRPEFVAQMAGYMQSPQKQKGLHALIDVGGGTLDIVTFIVHKVEDEDTFPFLVPEVHPLGTHGLIQNRLVGGPVAATPNAIDELQPIASPADFARTAGIEVPHVNKRDQIFVDEVSNVIRSVLEVTRSRRYRLSDAWASGVRTFFTGGGSNVDLYSQATQSARASNAEGLMLMPLPPHPKLDGFAGNDEEYQRISVACGLAQDSFTLGRVVPAIEVEDDRPSIAASRERQDRDDLYPK